MMSRYVLGKDLTQQVAHSIYYYYLSMIVSIPQQCG